MTNWQIIWHYVLALLKGVFIMLVLLTWSLERTQTGWTIPVTYFTAWIFLSWLLCYPALRSKYKSLYSKSGEHFETYKHRALTMHHQDKGNSHVNRRWTAKGEIVNPWEYTTGDTQSTDEVLNPVLVFAEHLWATFLLILLGPLLGVWAVVAKLVSWLRGR
ncbi:hypothetical protein [Levilactobacillus parabrevis]|uniref:hypothetical protein n=1 Tax=Levilactobacillus parabrevis TaxID=357278 RepID=UPI0021A46316|nr:hypothetical protein [Levilactobacillus parabrevis]MCT4487899.1 hypothetical protein [Levilactobacillus parabrevis]MCT4491235.1 hypothetical protein [Levilactobacillus parabrevis]